MTIQFQLTQTMVDRFVEFSGDRNAQHTDEQFARRFRYRRRVVHGMLPFSFLIVAAARENPGRAIDLKRADTRFLKPAFVGDTIRLELTTTPAGADALDYEAAWTNDQSGDVLTRSTGTLRLIEPAAPGSATPAAPCVLTEAIDENTLAAEQMTGQSAVVPFRVTPAHAACYADLIGAPADSPGPTTLATLLLSTLVGMRLPGRYATFLTWQITFDRPIDFTAPASLHATVEKVMTATESVNLAVSYSQSEEPIAAGKISALVSSPPRPLITCGEIREHHLDLGLRDKVALVTGSSRGIGATTAKVLAMHGCKTIVNYHRGRDDAEAIVADIIAAGGSAVALACDVSDERQVREMFEQLVARFGGLDILVNNAVRDANPRDAADLRWSDYLAELDVTLKGMMLCCQSAVPLFRARGGGKIVNLSTIYVDNPVKGQGKYITAKSAVIGFTRALVRELAGENIHVNVLSPNMTETDLLATLPPAMVKKIAQSRPAGRNLQPVEVAQAIVFLASRWSNSMTGQKVVLNLGEPPFT